VGSVSGEFLDPRLKMMTWRWRVGPAISEGEGKEGTNSGVARRATGCFIF
jgi:hypothetical protein